MYRYKIICVCAAAKSLQSCPTLCDPIDGSPPGSPVPGILQARTLEWVASSLSNAWKWKVKVKSLSHVQLLATPWTAAHQAPPSMGFSRQEYWSGCHCLLLYVCVGTHNVYMHTCTHKYMYICIHVHTNMVGHVIVNIYVFVLYVPNMTPSAFFRFNPHRKELNSSQIKYSWDWVGI